MEDFHCWVSTSGVENPPKVHKAIGHPLSEHKVLGLISSTKTERGGGVLKKKTNHRSDGFLQDFLAKVTHPLSIPALLHCYCFLILTVV